MTGPILPPDLAALRRLTLLSVALVVATACGSSDRAVTDSAGSAQPSAIVAGADTSVTDPYDDAPEAAESGEEEEVEEPKNTANLTSFRGQLSKDARDYESDVKGFHDVVSGKGWHGWRRNRLCKGHANCENGAKSGKLVVQAIHDAHKVPVALPAGNKGVVIGRLMNVGDYRDSTLDVPPKAAGRKPDEYYFIVQPGTTDKAVLMVARLTFGADDKPTSLDVDSAPDGFVKCGHTKTPKVRGTADFKVCPPTRSNGGGKGGSASAPMRLADAADALAWFSCDDGCCTAQWPPSANRLFASVGR